MTGNQRIALAVRVLLLGGLVIALAADPAAADNCSTLSDCTATQDAANIAAWGLLLLIMLSLILDLLPVVGDIKGGIEGFTGRDLITDQDLEPWERALGAVPLFGRVGVLFSVARYADDAADLARAAGKVADAADLARHGDDVVTGVRHGDDPADAARHGNDSRKSDDVSGGVGRRHARKPSTARSARDAREAGLVDLQHGRAGFHPHNRAPSVRKELGLSGAEFESAHILPQAIGQHIPGYSPGRALTTLLPEAVHNAFDRGWLKAWDAAKRSGQPITVADVQHMIDAAIEGIPETLLSQQGKGTLSWKLFDELYNQLGLKQSTVIYP